MTVTILQRVRTGRGGCTSLSVERGGRDITSEEAIRSDVDVTVIVPLHNRGPYLEQGA